VVSWYRRHDYHFLVLSDHNYLTEIGELQRMFGDRGRFTLIPGEEVTNTLGRQEIHLNGYGVRREIPRQTGTTVGEIVQKSVDAIIAAGGIASINHPNYTWAIDSKLMSTVNNVSLFEVFNGSWSVSNRGGGGHESTEEIWDAVLKSGRKLYGVAVDDAHDFQPYGRALPYPPTVPGGGWIQIRAAELTPDSVLDALRKGEFYASTGAALDDIQVSKTEIQLTIHQTRDYAYRTYFIGAGGKILATSDDLNPSYRIRGGEGYVRTRIEESTGGNAWTQPVRVD
jgi:hypothetical protein